MPRKFFALVGCLFLAQGCTISLQTNPGDITELKSLVLAQSAANAARAPNASPATIVVVSPTPASAVTADPALTASPPKTVTRRFASGQQPEIEESKK